MRHKVRNTSVADGQGEFAGRESAEFGDVEQVFAVVGEQSVEQDAGLVGEVALPGRVGRGAWVGVDRGLEQVPAGGFAVEVFLTL